MDIKLGQVFKINVDLNDKEIKKSKHGDYYTLCTKIGASRRSRVVLPTNIWPCTFVFLGQKSLYKDAIVAPRYRNGTASGHDFWIIPLRCVGEFMHRVIDLRELPTWARAHALQYLKNKNIERDITHKLFAEPVGRTRCYQDITWAPKNQVHFFTENVATSAMVYTMLKYKESHKKYHRCPSCNSRIYEKHLWGKQNTNIDIRAVCPTCAGILTIVWDPKADSISYKKFTD